MQKVFIFGRLRIKKRVMLTNALRALVNNPFYESFDTTFMENKNKKLSKH